MLSILHFVNTDARGGVEEHVINLLRGLDRTFCRLYLVCAPAVADLIRADIPSDVEMLSLEMNGARNLAAAVRFGRILRERRIDIVHSHMFQSSRFASPIARLCGTPVIVEQPHIRELWRQGWFSGSFFVDRCVGRMVDRYIAVSRANAAYLERVKGLPAEKITVIPPITNLSRFETPLPPDCVSRHSLGIADGDRVLVVIGRLEAQKGHRVLLSAMPSILAHHPRTRLVIVGDGSLRAELQRQSVQLQIEDSLRFVGYQSEVREWIALADLTVLPSFYEGLPLVALESLAGGRPMVASAVDGTPEVVREGETGSTVPAGDPGALALAICRLLSDLALRRRMGDAGRRYVLEHFAEGRLVAQTQELYQGAWEEYARRHATARAGQAHAVPKVR